MNRSKYTLALSILIVFGIGFAIGHSCISYSTANRNLQNPDESDGLPSVNAKIIKVSASPDFSRIALVLQQQNGQSIAVFDALEKRIIARETSNDQLPQFSWSSDSKYLAASVDKGIILIDKNGRVHCLHGNGSYVIWQPTDPNKLVYSMTDPQTQDLILREYDMPTNSDRMVLRLPDDQCIGIFSVKGRLCVALLYRVKPSSYTWDKIDIMDIYSKDRIVRIPGCGWDFDWAAFDMSPDGQAFTIKAGVSGGAVFIIGRTSEAATTLQYLTRAVLYEGNAGGTEEVVWALSNSPRCDATETSKKPDYALVNSDVFPCMLLNLVSGSSYSQVGHLKNISYIGWWKCDAKHSAIWKQQFLVVGSDGLWITSNPKAVDNTPKDSAWPDDSQLILRHRSRLF